MHNRTTASFFSPQTDYSGSGLITLEPHNSLSDWALHAGRQLGPWIFVLSRTHEARLPVRSCVLTYVQFSVRLTCNKTELAELSSVCRDKNRIFL